MSERSSTRAVASWRARDLVLLICALWLVVQNTLLAAWLTSQHFGPILVAARILLRVGVRLAAEFWMLPLAALLGVALALSTGERQDADRASREISHAGL
jgi:hypothetical protein